ncbi:MAG: hypothetical protein ABJL99_05815 [Aliishimia sp.]
MTNIPAWKVYIMRGHVRAVLRAGGTSSTDLQNAVHDRMSDEESEKMGTLGWHLCRVRLEMHMRADIVRVPEKGPLKLRLAS